MVVSDPWSDSIDIIALNTVLKYIGINQMGLSAPWAESLVITSLQSVKN